MVENKTCQNFDIISLVTGRWKTVKQARHDRGRCIDSFKFFRWMKHSYTYLFVPFYMYQCSGQLIHC